VRLGDLVLRITFITTITREKMKPLVRHLSVHSKKLNRSSTSNLHTVCYNIISRCVHSQGNTSRRRPRQEQNNSRSPNQHRLEKMNTKEGLSISQAQIGRLWSLFDVTHEDDDGNTCAQEFDAIKFASKYPNVNKSLSAKILSSDAPSPEISLSVFDKDAEETAIEDIFNPMAQEAELKLQRMLAKINNPDTLQLPSDVQLKIRTLLTEELEAVLDLWIKISHTNECQTLQQAVTVTDRAMDLLLQFQLVNEQGMKIGPPIHCYQAVLHNYHSLFTVNESTLGVNDLLHFQKRGKGLLKGMIKQVITARMQALNGGYEEGLSSLNKERPLHDSYNAVIGMHTSERITNQPMVTSSSEHEGQSLATEMINGSSKLLQEMELYYHDFHNNHLPLEDQALQDFVITIYPTKESFQKVIGGFVSVAVEYGCAYSIQRAVDVLERCGKRCLAYEKSGGDNMDQVVTPDEELYGMVLHGFKNMSGHLNLDKIENLMKDSSVDDKNLMSLLREIREGRES